MASRPRLAVCILLLALCAPAIPADAPAMKSIFLVARKGMADPRFRDTVVLVTRQDGPGPIGVIINRRTEVTLGTALRDFEGLESKGERVHFGGPVQPDGLVAVFRAAKQPADSVEVLDGVYFTRSRDVLMEVLARTHPPGGLRVYAGFASWAPGQLESELSRGVWHLARADAAAVFSRNPERLWQEMERKAAATTALLAR